MSFSEECLSLFFDTFFARLQNSEKRLLALSILFVHPSFGVFVSPSVCVEQLNSRSTDFHEILIFEVSFENLLGTFKPHYNVTRTLGTFYEDLCTFI